MRSVVLTEGNGQLEAVAHTLTELIGNDAWMVKQALILTDGSDEIVKQLMPERNPGPFHQRA